jgi:GTP-binding protein Era
MSPGASKRKQKKPAGARAKGAPKAGTIALVGRPNVGKSSLLNAMVGARLAITSHHPQTTRERVAGILSEEQRQYVFLDTPGVHRPKNRLGKRMNDVASGTAADADVALLVVDVGPLADPEQHRAADVAASATIPKGTKTILVVNKIDRVREKEKLFGFLGEYGNIRDFAAVVPVSAKKRDGLDRLRAAIDELLPEGEPLYPEDELSDRPVRFFVAEMLREQVLLRTRQEVPHGVAVTVDAYEEPKSKGKPVRITLTVHVAKDSHKGIVIGQKGQMLQAIGTAARERAEKLLGHKVHLDVRVTATPGWFDDAARLVDFGLDQDGEVA